MKTIKILFVEDHEMVRDGIKLMLENQNSFIADIDEAVDGREALEKAGKNKYDVILLDISLPFHDGVYITKYLTSRINHVRILALTMHKEDVIIREMMEAGALGYILKNSGIDELTRAILTVFKFENYYSNPIAISLIKNNKININNPNETSPIKNIINNNISQRELEVLKLIALEFTNKQIAEKLKISERTVGNHRNKLIHKLLVKNSIGLATYAVKMGLV